MKLITLVPSLLLLLPTSIAQSVPSGFTPSVNATLDVYYGTQYISPGLIVKKSVTQKAPTIGIANGKLTGKYILAMIDIDGSSGGKATTVLHTLLSDFTPSGTTQNSTQVLTTKATGPSSYFGPAPPAGQPATHRYVFLLHEQPDGFAVPASQKNVVQSRLGIDWVKFVSEAGLKAPIAGNYLQVKSGDNS